MSEVKRARVIVSGRVQGVYFRANTKDTANRLKLTGWVRNLHDGRVEAVFEGEADKVAEAVKWCRRGPERSRVDDVEVLWEKASDDYPGFEVRY